MKYASIGQWGQTAAINSEKSRAWFDSYEEAKCFGEEVAANSNGDILMIGVITDDYRERIRCYCDLLPATEVIDARLWDSKDGYAVFLPLENHYSTAAIEPIPKKLLTAIKKWAEV